MATVYTLTMKEDLVPVSNNRGLLQTYQATLVSIGRVAAKVVGSEAHLDHCIVNKQVTIRIRVLRGH